MAVPPASSQQHHDPSQQHHDPRSPKSSDVSGSAAARMRRPRVRTPPPPPPISPVHSPINCVAQSDSLAISALYSLPSGRWCRQTYHCTFCRESVLAHAHASLTHPRTLSLILRSLSHSFSLPPLILSRPPAISLEQACLCLCPHISLSLARARSLAHACYDNVIKQLF